MITYPNVKVNVGLNVLRRRPDGFHDIETLFVPFFGMTDVLEIVPSESFSIEIFSAKPGIPDWDPMSDLCAKAWRLMNGRFGIPPVAISLEKRNPVGAGLGGGSSDAAFTLRMLNELFSLSLSDGELASLAAELGSDCPFFIFNRPMFGEGRGERLTDFPLPDIDFSGAEPVIPAASLSSSPSPSPSPVRSSSPAARYRLGVIALDEKLSISTAAAYRSITPSEPETGLRQALALDVTRWRGIVRNDFEPVIAAAHPIVRETVEACYARGCVYAAMSGSGPSVFFIR